MPRAPTAAVSMEPVASTSTAAPGINVPAPLRRNQACHRCRKRKIRCDADRPACGSCRLAVATARNGPPKCSYDDMIDLTQPIHEPRNKYQRLESRISELESLLAAAQQQKEERRRFLASHARPPSPTADSVLSILTATYPPPSETTSIPSNLYGDGFPSEAFDLHSIDAGNTAEMVGLYFPRSGVLAPSWPVHFPLPDMLLHLTEVFFLSHPNASRILHRPTFMRRLSLPTADPNFPHASLIHAICAYASIFSPITDASNPDFSKGSINDLYVQRRDRGDQRQQSFGDQHAKYCREASDDCIRLGESMFDAFQAAIILSWYYYALAKWVEVWRSSGASLRYSIPLGLNNTPLKTPLHPWLSPSVLPEAKNVIEEETRRNTFWLAYVMERWQVSATAWSTALDDEDITQVLPLRFTDWENGDIIPVPTRQSIGTPHILTTHIPEQTDLFTMYIKGVILLSRIKSFNSRFDPKSFAQGHEKPEHLDPRETAPFKNLDSMISSYITHFPQEYRELIKPGGMFDSNLYVACTTPHVATILLHEPHSNPSNPICPSAQKSLAASLEIINLIHTMLTTSFNVCQIESIITFAWYISGRVCIRFHRLSVENGNVGEAARLEHSISIARLALQKMGERVPVAYRQARALDELQGALPLGPEYNHLGQQATLTEVLD